MRYRKTNGACSAFKGKVVVSYGIEGLFFWVKMSKTVTTYDYIANGLVDIPSMTKAKSNHSQVT